MQKIDNWDKIQAADGGERGELEPGGYICKIMGAKVATYHGQNGDFDRIEISIDIDEGDFKGFYAEDYRSQAMWSDKQKWKGALRPYVPTDEDTPQANRSQAIFKGITDAIEASNPGYKWDWDENKLKGKRVGVMFRSEEYDYNGYHGWKTRPYRFESVDFIKAGKFETPKPKGLPENKKPTISTVAPATAPYPNSNPDNFTEISASDDDLPF